MRIYMIRHGETDLNEKGCYYGRAQAELTERGRKQAESFRSFFESMNWSAIVVSPLKRTVDTAMLATGLSRDSFIMEDRLMEQDFGIFEAKTYGELCREFPEEMNQWNADYDHYVIPDGESFQQVRERVEDWYESIPKGEGCMLVVAHKGTLGHMLASMLGMPLSGYWNFVFDQGTYTCVDVEDGYAIIRKLNQSL